MVEHCYNRIEFSNVFKKCHQELNFVPQHLLLVPPSWRNKVCEVVVVPSCTYFLVPVLQAGYLHYYTALNQFVQFVEDRVWLLECSPASCLAPQNHCKEKREKFITHRWINNKLPSHFSFDTGTVLNLKSRREHIFSFGWIKNSFSQEKTSSFERHTILSHLPRILKVFWWLTYPFLFNNKIMILFISHGSVQVCYHQQTCMSHWNQRFTWILASKMLASFSRYKYVACFHIQFLQL